MLLFDFIEFLSFSFGFFCIFLWSIVLVPQFITTYKTKSSNAISFSMIMLIFIGDSFSTISASKIATNPIIFYTGIFYIVFDIIFILQWLYYNYKSYNSYEHLNNSFWQNYPWIQNTQLKYNEFYFKITVFLFLFCLLFISPFFINNTIAILFSWLSVISYFSSRIPQIFLNYKRQSTNGLSIYTFILIFFANICFFCSIIIKSNFDDSYLFQHAPWLIGCIISTFFDFTIFYQFIIYRNTNDQYSVLSFDYDYHAADIENYGNDMLSSISSNTSFYSTIGTI